ncbi:MAG: hypothetical protein Kow00109_10020 [Acidobacteriota bacterium]
MEKDSRSIDDVEFLAQRVRRLPIEEGIYRRDTALISDSCCSLRGFNAKNLVTKLAVVLELGAIV